MFFLIKRAVVVLTENRFSQDAKCLKTTRALGGSVMGIHLSVLPGKHQNNTLIKPQPLPSRLFSIHYLLVIQSSDGV
jgi:hypothetical protein